jgi:hypothetical protein
MKHAIFIKSCQRDLPWLDYCLQSIEKFATGFSEVVIVLPQVCAIPQLHIHNARIVRVDENPQFCNGYLYQQVCKMHSDTFTDADFILHMDSDTLFTESVTPDSFKSDGKAAWLQTPMEHVSNDARKAWTPCMRDFFGVSPEFEFMRRQGQMIPRDAYPLLREYCMARHRVLLRDYIMSRQSFSEFNVMGMFLYLEHRNLIAFHNTDTEGVPKSVVQQFWSHGGLNPSVRSQIASILK